MGAIPYPPKDSRKYGLTRSGWNEGHGWIVVALVALARACEMRNVKTRTRLDATSPTRQVGLVADPRHRSNGQNRLHSRHRSRAQVSRDVACGMDPRPPRRCVERGRHA